MIKKKVKYQLVNHNGSREVMSGSEISLLQMSGSKVKVLSSATICVGCNNKTYLAGECYHCGFDASEVDLY